MRWRERTIQEVFPHSLHRRGTRPINRHRQRGWTSDLFSFQPRPELGGALWRAASPGDSQTSPAYHSKPAQYLYINHYVIAYKPVQSYLLLRLLLLPKLVGSPVDTCLHPWSTVRPVGCTPVTLHSTCIKAAMYSYLSINQCCRTYCCASFHSFIHSCFMMFMFCSVSLCS
jgi:hypothetical protein